MIVAVTGATGFIGRTLAMRLAASGADMPGVVRDTARAGDLDATPGVELVGGDLEDPPLLRDPTGRAGIVDHLAGRTSARIRDELGYRSRISLEAGVASSLAWYRTQGWL